jgi:hypothetical protein
MDNNINKVTVSFDQRPDIKVDGQKREYGEITVNGKSFVGVQIDRDTYAKLKNRPDGKYDIVLFRGDGKPLGDRAIRVTGGHVSKLKTADGRQQFARSDFSSNRSGEKVHRFNAAYSKAFADRAELLTRPDKSDASYEQQVIQNAIGRAEELTSKIDRLDEQITNSNSGSTRPTRKQLQAEKSLLELERSNIDRNLSRKLTELEELNSTETDRQIPNEATAEVEATDQAEMPTRSSRHPNMISTFDNYAYNELPHGVCQGASVLWLNTIHELGEAPANQLKDDRSEDIITTQQKFETNELNTDTMVKKGALKARHTFVPFGPNSLRLGAQNQPELGTWAAQHLSKKGDFAFINMQHDTGSNAHACAMYRGEDDAIYFFNPDQGVFKYSENDIANLQTLIESHADQRHITLIPGEMQ